jgi:hypothetical protein
MLLLEHGAPFGLVLNAPTLDAEHECVDTQQVRTGAGLLQQTLVL